MKRFGIIATTVALAILATSAVASAQMGVAAMWTGSGIAPIMALPIAFGEGMVLQPMVGIHWESDKGQYFPGTAITLGSSFEKGFGTGDTHPLFGGKLAVDIYSPKVGDSWTNFNVGVFLGGSAKLADNVTLVGQWGPTITAYGKKGTISGESYTTLDSEASITLRWWVFGN
jgi:hypothetical protein